MKPIVYTVVGSKGRWFIVHTGGRYGPFPTKRQALKIAVAASAEGERHGFDVTVEASGKGEPPD